MVFFLMCISNQAVRIAENNFEATA